MTTQRDGALRRIHITGVSDVHNFGDALFPLIAARRLAPLGYEVVPASPTGAALIWPDAMRSVAIERLLSEQEDSSGLLLGGGHIILADVPSLLFGSHPGYSAGAIPSLWLGASLIAALRDLPVAWNAPGVFGPLAGPELRATASAAIGLAGYVAVRDHHSRALLGEQHAMRVNVAPDTALELAALWPRRDLRTAFRRLMERKGMDSDRPLLAVHLRRMDPSEDGVAELAARITAFAASHGVMPALVAIGPDAGDARTHRQLSRHLGVAHLLLDDPLSLREIAALIAHAVYYVGNSLHGYVAAASYGVPGLLVAKPPARRFRGFLEQYGRPQDFARGWGEAFALTATRLQERPAATLPAAIVTGLDRHWAAVAACLALGRAADGEARLAFLRHYMGLGHRRAGGAWSLLPVASREYAVGRSSGASAPEAEHAG
jgi:polysaccharide pyruvyl transferase WcaK-like protein